MNDNWVLGILVHEIVVQALGKYMTIGCLDPPLYDPTPSKPLRGFLGLRAKVVQHHPEVSI